MCKRSPALYPFPKVCFLPCYLSVSVYVYIPRMRYILPGRNTPMFGIPRTRSSSAHLIPVTAVVPLSISRFRQSPATLRASRPSLSPSSARYVHRRSRLRANSHQSLSSHPRLPSFSIPSTSPPKPNISPPPIPFLTRQIVPRTCLSD